VHGFLVEVLAVPIIHKFFVEHLKAGTRLPPGVLRHVALLDGLQQQDFSAFAPEHAAGPDAVHKFGRVGALGQIKFRASLSQPEWADALRIVDRAQLYSEKPNDTVLSARAQEQRETRLANKLELRRQANARLDTLWPDGYCSYIFTICEPPADVRHEQLVDGRKLFVFSPRLSPRLFDGVAGGVDVWKVLAKVL
jgi:hypothetical protein